MTLQDVEVNKPVWHGRNNTVTGVRGSGLGSGTQRLGDFGQITYQYSEP